MTLIGVKLSNSDQQLTVEVESERTLPNMATAGTPSPPPKSPNANSLLCPGTVPTQIASDNVYTARQEIHHTSTL